VVSRPCPATAGARYLGGVADEQLAGVRPAQTAPVAGTSQISSYPGEKYGLPEHGSTSVPGLGRRLVALFIDWILCAIIATGLLHSQYWTLAFFGAETYILTVLTGTTIGKRVLGMRVARLDGKPVGLGWGLVRTVLLLTVVPPLVMDRDRRGLHDKAANTIVVRI
jgi:RDD family